MAAKEHGFIKLYRSMVDWEWYATGPTKAVFLHLLLTANYRPKQWKGILIGRGQRAASYGTLARECGLTESQTRTAVMHLKRTGEITVKPYRNFSLITVCNYERFQGEEDGTPQTESQAGDVAAQRAGANSPQPADKLFATTKEEEELLEIFSKYAGEEHPLFHALIDFAEMRRERGRPMTRRAGQMLCRKLDRLKAAGEDVRVCVENSVLYGWTGVYPAGQQPKKPAQKAAWLAGSQQVVRKKKPRETEIYHSGRYDFEAIEKIAGEKLRRKM